MRVKEIRARSILSRSRVFDYAVNPYTGCQYGCAYCYARFMKRFTGHEERWGDFVDVKVNAAELLRREVTRKPPGRVWVSGVCDPYQPLEERYELTRGCLEVLVRCTWPVTVQTKSALVLRDIDLLRWGDGVEVGLTVTTADDAVRRLFEVAAPSIAERVHTLDELHRAGIRTYAMIAPMLPGAEGLAGVLRGKVDYVLIDRMNYRYGDRVYRRHGLTWAASDEFFSRTGGELAAAFRRQATQCRLLF